MIKCKEPRWVYKDRCEARTWNGEQCRNQGKHIEQWRDGSKWRACGLHAKRRPHDLIPPPRSLAVLEGE